MTTEQELTEQLNRNPNSVIWSQKVDAGNAIRSFGFYLVLYGGIVFYYFDLLRKVNVIDAIMQEMVTMTEVASMLVLAVFFIVLHSTNALVASTITYKILPKEINFSWGLFKRQNVSIPFTKITGINLVKYEDKKFSTIYFGTSEKYKIKKLDFDKGESRAHITFEKIKEGDKVYELLNLLWKRK